MFRTVLVLLFLAACGFYFHHDTKDTVQSSQRAPQAAKPQTVDDSPLEALKKALPASLFEKDVQPSIEQNRREGLTAEQLAQLLARLQGMGNALGGKASEAVDKAVKDIEAAMPDSKDMGERSAKVAGMLGRKMEEGVQESLPVIKEMAADIMKAMVAVLSQLLNTATELLEK